MQMVLTDFQFPPFDVFVPVCDDTAVHFAVSRTSFLSVLFLWITVLRRASDAIFERKSL